MQLISAFNHFDKDGDGYITNSNLAQFLRLNGNDDVPSDFIDYIISEVDLDKDGKIDPEEFIAMTVK